MAGYAEIFWRNVQSSGVIPQISLVMGPCAGGAVYSPAMTDFVLMVEETSYMFITGPDVVKTVTGEEVTFEELGGAATHASKSGVAHFMSPDEEACLEDARYLLSFLPQNTSIRRPSRALGSGRPRVMPSDTLIPDNPNSRTTSGRRAARGRRGRVSWGARALRREHRLRLRSLGGPPDGVVGNPAACARRRARHQLAVKDARSFEPVTRSHPARDVRRRPGFLPGTAQEWGGIIRHGRSCCTSTARPRCPSSRSSRAGLRRCYDVMSSKHIRAAFQLRMADRRGGVMGRRAR